jgi:hypothetical protein
MEVSIVMWVLNNSKVHFSLFYPKYFLQFGQEKLEAENNFGSPDVDGRTILKWILRDSV